MAPMNRTSSMLVPDQVLVQHIMAGNWSVAENEFQMGPPIAEGAEGKVMKCTLRGEPCVAKMLKAQTNATAHDDLIRELDLFCSIHDHPNIIKFLGACIKDLQNPILFEEYAGGPTLGNFMAGRKGKLGKPTVFIWTRDLLSGLDFLHNRNPIIIHRDLKPANLLLTSDLKTLKIADFGLAKAVDFRERDSSVHSGNTGTKRFMAPEVRSVAAGHYDEKADIWSAALICWHIATGQLPPISPDNALHIRPVEKWMLWKSYEDLIVQMWAHDPASRPSAQKCLQILDSFPDIPDLSKGAAPESPGCCCLQ